MYDDDHDPWEGRTPWLRRPGVLRVLVGLVVGSFLILTLMSTCAPRRRAPATTTTTTRPGIQAIHPQPLG